VAPLNGGIPALANPELANLDRVKLDLAFPDLPSSDGGQPGRQSTG
jgi:hypothetical protein